MVVQRRPTNYSRGRNEASRPRADCTPRTDESLNKLRIQANDIVPIIFEDLKSYSWRTAAITVQMPDSSRGELDVHFSRIMGSLGRVRGLCERVPAE